MEKLEKVLFNTTPKIEIRVINANDKEIVKESKTNYPFKLENNVVVTIQTDKCKFSFKIPSGYIWNGADIPKFFWRIIGSKNDNAFLIASMVHDYMLQYKKFVIEDILKNELSTMEYRHLTSLVFRELVKQSGTKTLKANVMSWCVDVYQKFCNKRGWRL